MLDKKISRPHEEVLDEVYAKYAQNDPFMRIVHFVSHSTMGPEALVGLGLGHRVPEWISRHPAKLYKAPHTGISIASSWKQALGRQDCHGDWLEYFENELKNHPYEEVLGRWVPLFAHDVGTLLFHGLIRTAHAVRALDHKDTPGRRGELAQGLSLWAIGVKSAPPSDALLGDKDEIINYAKIGAATLIHEPSVPTVHLVTGPMAYRMIAHHLDAKTHRIASASFAKTHARAVQNFNSIKSKALSEPALPINEQHENSIVASRDAHPAKLTEAALRAHQETGDPIFLIAAGKALSLHSLSGVMGIAKVMFRRGGTKEATETILG